jgi:hypothetical protein
VTAGRRIAELLDADPAWVKTTIPTRRRGFGGGTGWVNRTGPWTLRVAAYRSAGSTTLSGWQAATGATFQVSFEWTVPVEIVAAAVTAAGELNRSGS